VCLVHGKRRKEIAREKRNGKRGVPHDFFGKRKRMSRRPIPEGKSGREEFVRTERPTHRKEKRGQEKHLSRLIYDGKARRPRDPRKEKRGDIFYREGRSDVPLQNKMCNCTIGRWLSHRKRERGGRKSHHQPFDPILREKDHRLKA